MKFLKPKSLLELGCGRGDILFLLGLDRRIKVRGIEFSQDVLKKVWPFLSDNVDYGDVLEVCKKYLSRKITFDTFCAFDLWEHILPGKLHDYIDSFVSLAEKDALFFFTIPAFGEDRVFGEIFPLEFEENLKKFDARSPFDYLIVETKEPPIPVKGHLICAHTANGGRNNLKAMDWSGLKSLKETSIPFLTSTSFMPERVFIFFIMIPRKRENE